MEDAVDAVSNVRPDNTASLGLGVRLDHITELSEQSARLHQLDGLLETLTRSLDDAHRVRVRLGPVTNVVCFVEIAVEALVVEGHVEVNNIAVEKNTLIGDAVADDLVDRGADGLWEVVIVERGGIRL